MKRRKFIANTSAIVLPALLNGFSAKVLGQENIFSSLLGFSGTETDRVLVIIQLFGGNDGLNTVIPITQYENYYKARTNLAIAEKKILSVKGDTSFGFHPSLTGFRELFDEGRLAILQSVGYPSPNFSHFRSSDIWMSGSGATQSVSTGWAGRYLSQLHPKYPDGFPNEQVQDPLAIQIGSATSFLFQGNKSPMAVNIADPGNVYNLLNGFTDAPPQTNGGRQLDFIRLVAQQSQAYSQVIKKAADRVTLQAEYPVNNSLAAQLKIIARLIKSGLKTKIYLASFDGFDTHAQQVNPGDTSTGRHADLLKTVGDAIKAFQGDLDFLQIQDRVLGMTFSEFGRRIASNDSLGTDHGAAAPLFIFGPNVKGGVYGQGPEIPANVTHDDNLVMQTDFRAVYASVLSNWMKVPKHDVSNLLFKDFESLQFIRS
jgi:uncharacterized protein (DUF1501 family)